MPFTMHCDCSIQLTADLWPGLQVHIINAESHDRYTEQTGNQTPSEETLQDWIVDYPSSAEVEVKHSALALLICKKSFSLCAL